jgi:hypothetical protein
MTHDDQSSLGRRKFLAGLERLLLVQLTESTSGLAKGYYEYQAQARPRGRTLVFGGSWTLPIPKQPTL